MESLAEGYRRYVNRKRQVRAKELPWWKKMISAIITKWKRYFGRFRSDNKNSWRVQGRDQAFDKSKAIERKSLYIKEQRIAVYTALFGSYDILRDPLIQPDNVVYYVLTDQEIAEESVWKRLDPADIIPAEYRGDPILCNRWCKMHPHLIFKDFQYSVYVDSNIWVFSDLTPLISGLDTFPVAMFRHKKRDCAYDEVQACLKQNKDKRASLIAHCEELRSHGVPRNWGLLEASVIARKHFEPECVKLMDAWWEAFLRNSRRDQISLIDCLWVKGVQPSVIGTLGDNLQRCDLFIQMYHENAPEAANQPIDLPGLLKCVGLS